MMKWKTCQAEYTKNSKRQLNEVDKTDSQTKNCSKSSNKWMATKKRLVSIEQSIWEWNVLVNLTKEMGRKAVSLEDAS